MSDDRRARICALNDQLRCNHIGGRIVLTPGVVDRGQAFLLTALDAIRRFDEFNEGCDPYGERDFGAITIGSDRLFWKIDYYDQSLTSAAVDPAEETDCVRVMTVMLAAEY